MLYKNGINDARALIIHITVQIHGALIAEQLISVDLEVIDRAVTVLEEAADRAILGVDVLELTRARNTHVAQIFAQREDLKRQRDEEITSYNVRTA